MTPQVKDNLAIAAVKGTMAAHEKVTPLCPYSSIYDTKLYRRWYDSLALERQFINSVKKN